MTTDLITKELSELSNMQLVQLLAGDGLSERLLAETSLRLGVEGTSATRAEAGSLSEAARRHRYVALWRRQPEIGRTTDSPISLPHRA